MFTVNVKYYGVAIDVARTVAPICPTFQSPSSYVDTPAYAGTALASNVAGWGVIPGGPDVEVGVPFPAGIHNFNVSKLGEKKKDETGTYIEAELKVDTAKDALFYRNLAVELKDQGYVITVTEDSDAASE